VKKTRQTEDKTTKTRKRDFPLEAHRPGFPDRCVLLFALEKAVSGNGTFARCRAYLPVPEERAMLVERGLRVMNVEVVGDAYAIASNYLRRTGAIADSFVTNERLLEIIVEMFQAGEMNRLRLANKAIAKFEAVELV
jgi:hypothetical protein